MLSYVLMMLHDLANDGGYISLRWRTEMGGDTAKGCQKPALQQKTTDDEIISPVCLEIISTQKVDNFALFKYYQLLLSG